MLQKSLFLGQTPLLKVEPPERPFSSLLASRWQTTSIPHQKDHSCLHLWKGLWTLHLQIVLLSELGSLCLPSHHESCQSCYSPPHRFMLIYRSHSPRPRSLPEKVSFNLCDRSYLLCSQPCPHLLTWQTVQGGNEHFKTSGYYCNSGKYCY